jgi:hypothetical protein
MFSKSVTYPGGCCKSWRHSLCQCVCLLQKERVSRQRITVTHHQCGRCDQSAVAGHSYTQGSHVLSSPPSTRMVVSKRFTSFLVISGWKEVETHSRASANSSFSPISQSVSNASISVSLHAPPHKHPTQGRSQKQQKQRRPTSSQANAKFVHVPTRGQTSHSQFGRQDGARHDPTQTACSLSMPTAWS